MLAQTLNVASAVSTDPSVNPPTSFGTASTLIAIITTVALAILFCTGFNHHWASALSAAHQSQATETFSALSDETQNWVLESKQVGTGFIVLKIGNIVNEPADVIVNAANAQLKAGGGVCGAIFAAAGQKPFDECQAILRGEGLRAINVGDARITKSGRLREKGIKRIIHAVGPQQSGEAALRSAYRTSLNLASRHGCRTIAFPSISTGIYGYPIHEAATAALDEIKIFLTSHPDTIEEVRFVFFDPGRDSQRTACIYHHKL